MAAQKILAIICNSLPPYRVHLHHRLRKELTGWRILTINTHQDMSRAWSTEGIDQINLRDLSDQVTGVKTSRIIGHIKEWKRGKRIISELNEQKADAVIVNGYNDLGRIRVLRWCKASNRPCFMWADSNIASDKASGIKRAAKHALINKVSKWVNGFFACGRLGKAYWESYGVERDRIYISPYEPDYEMIQSIDADMLSQVQEKFNLPPQRRRLVYSGRLVPVKRVDLLVNAFVNILDERPDWDLVILGDGPLRKVLQSVVPKDQQDRCRWLGFQSNQKMISAIYRCSDALVLPSTYEPWALVINEAVAAGLAIITTDVVGAAAELLRDGENGRVIKPDSLEQLTEALLDITNPDHIDRYKSASLPILNHWREIGDPVDGITSALANL